VLISSSLNNFFKSSIHVFTNSLPVGIPDCFDAPAPRIKQNFLSSPVQILWGPILTAKLADGWRLILIGIKTILEHDQEPETRPEFISGFLTYS